MKKDQLAFLIGGLAIGLLLGFGLQTLLENRPNAKGAESGATPTSIPAPAGPPAPTQVAGGGAAPMIQEINALKQRVQDNPNDLESLIRLGTIYGRAGMWERADKILDQAADVHPDNPVLQRSLAEMYHDVERWDRAIAFYERTLALTPEDPDVLSNLGTVYKSIRNFDRALELYAEANRLDPNHWQSLLNIAIVIGFDLGRYDEAEAAIDRLERVRPDAPELHELREALAEERSRESPSGGS